MTAWKWPAVALVAIAVAGVVLLFRSTTDPEMQKQLLGYFEAIITFIVGAGAGAAVGGTSGYWFGRREG